MTRFIKRKNSRTIKTDLSANNRRSLGDTNRKRSEKNDRQNIAYFSNNRRAQLGQHRPVQIRYRRVDMRRPGIDSREDHIYARGARRHLVHLAVFQGEYAPRDERRKNEVNFSKKELKIAATAESAKALFAVALFNADLSDAMLSAKFFKFFDNFVGKTGFFAYILLKGVRTDETQ